MGESRLTLLYTANIAGRLESLPRLFSHIQKLRSEVVGPAAILDLGGTCDPAVWECAVTAGRAVLFVLDAMGYDVACLTADDCAGMDSAAKQKLQERTTTALCGLEPDSGFPPAVAWQTGVYRVACGSAVSDVQDEADLTIVPGVPEELVVLDPSERRLVLSAPDAGEVGIVTVTFDEARLPVSATYCAAPVPLDARQDATIAAAVEFVRDEARYYQQIQQRGAHETG